MANIHMLLRWLQVRTGRRQYALETVSDCDIIVLESESHQN